MCVDKPGCQCHWANLGPDHPRLRVPSTPGRQAPLGPPPTPLTTSNNLNTPARTTASAKKRKRSNNHKTPAKRQNTGSSAPVFGVGPSLTPVHENPQTTVDNGEAPARKAFPSLTRQNHVAVTSRHDIWGFMRPVNEDFKALYSDTTTILETFPRLTVRPKSDYVGCLLCE
jgi:hypothetical protein